MKQFHVHPSRGAGAIAVSMILLFAMTLAVFFASRSTVFEQRTSTNQMRSTKAFEMAEAGIEWALGRLNETDALQAAPNCAVSTASAAGSLKSFRERYLNPNNKIFSPNNTYRAGCSISSSGVATCSCPESGSPTFGASTDPRFAVQFVGSPGGDTKAVEIISYGCTGGSTCAPESSGAFDAEAVVRVIFKVVPEFPNAPGAGLVTGTLASTGGNMTVINNDPRSNGVTINSGSSVTLGGATSVVSLPGTSPGSSVLDNDPSLASITDDERFFRSFFGKSTTDYKNEKATYIIAAAGQCASYGTSRCSECSTASDCGTKVSAAIDGGAQALQFWIATDVQFNSTNLPTAGTLGTSAQPVTIAGTGEVEFKSAVTAYGMIYAQTGEWDYTGSGTARVYGAFVSRGAFSKGAGTLELIYDPDVFDTGGLKGMMVKVPGSWRDKYTTF